jgi:predicted transposase YbfD/YdcC
MAIPLLEGIDITGKDITSRALLTQRKLAEYVVGERHAHYHFTVKGNQPTLQQDIARLFQHRQAPDFEQLDAPEHGRIETRRIWCSTALNDYLDSCHYVLDWNFDEDRSRIRTGHGPENITRLRRFAIGLIQPFLKRNQSVAQKMRQLCRNTRLVFDYLRMSDNTCRPTTA